MIVLSDCIYEPTAIESLVATIATLSSEETNVWVCYQHRKPQVEENFRALLNLSMKVIEEVRYSVLCLVPTIRPNCLFCQKRRQKSLLKRESASFVIKRNQRNLSIV